MNLAQEPNDYRASGLARGLLELNNAAIDYTEPVEFPGQNSSKKAVELVERPTTLARHFGLSPNPTKGKVTLEWLKTELYPAELLTIRILDVQGKLLQKKTGIKLDLQRDVLNLSTLKNGTYLIEVRSNDQLLFNEKVVLQK
ncbi:MAG: T9SS type A sorting domain-containing protein [Bacteroidetes bacterium]|nr:T9SS type A sorting domain-containing protein [Bacteroidota bacterium]